LIEQPDDYREPVRDFAQGITRSLQGAWQAWRHDRDFRRLTTVAAIFGSSIMLFPHYQRLGLQDLHLKLDSLVAWVVIQNIGTGLFSIPAGRIADRHGNRMVLLIIPLGLATAPVLAIVLKSMPLWGARLFPLVFVFVGLTPIVLKTLQNFTLELCSPEDHPRYLSTLALCMTAPMLLSPIIGWLIDSAGFTLVFLTMAGVVFIGWLMTFGLREPRRDVHMDYLQSVD
jgi:MFS family permease